MNKEEREKREFEVDLKNWAAHPHQEFPGVPPGRGGGG